MMTGKPSTARGMFGFLAAGALAGAGFLAASGSAQACDSCNYSMLDQMLNERAETLVGRDILAAAENQRGMPLSGLSNVQAYSEQMLAQHSGEAGVVGSAASGSEPADPRAAIIQRDAGLQTPPTSYVDQDVEADHSFTIALSEGQTYIGNGVMYDGFVMDGKIPGRTLIVTEGDVVEFTVVNEGSVAHGASIHAAYTQTSSYLGSVQPGQSKSMKFRATVPGVYLYHCAPGGHAIPMHVLGGQYGMLVVEPREQQYKLEAELGHGPDLEIYLTQHEVYASGHGAVRGEADYTMFNGKLFRYVEEPIQARPGDYVRMYFMNVGPNLMSTFHIVGIVWDYVYWQGHPEAVLPGGQTVTAGPSDTWVIEFRIPPDEGAYTMLSHAVGSTSRGAIGLIVADFDGERSGTVLADGPSYTEEELTELAAGSSRTLSPFGIGTSLADRPVRHKDAEEEAVVQIIGNSYYPKVLEVPAGTTVTWVNEDVFSYLAGEFSGVHNVATYEAPAPFASPLLAHAETWSHTFTEVGAYDYLCAPHPYMRGRVKVVEATGSGVAAASSGPGWASLLVVGGVAGVALLLGALPGWWILRRQPAWRRGLGKGLGRGFGQAA